MRHLLLILLLSCATALTAQCANETTPQALALKAYLANDLALWDAAVTAAQALPTSEANALALAQIAYGAVTASMVKEDDDRMDKYLDITEAALDQVWETNKKDPAANGLYSGYLGMLIAQTPIKGMIYGSKASKYAAKGVVYGPTNAAANFFLGSNLFYTPEQWGGDLKESVKHLQAAKELFAASKCEWLKLENLALLGQALKRSGDTEGARLVYLEALQLQPDFGYVKNYLMPQL